LWPLAHLANKHDLCWPSIAYLADVCELGESTVRRMIQELAARKLLTIERRFGDNGGCRSNVYRLAIAPSFRSRGYPSTVTGELVSSVTGGWSQDEGLTTTGTVMYEQLLQAGAGCAGAQARQGGSSDFHFPKSMSDAERRELGMHLRCLSHEQAQDVLDELAGRMEDTDVHNPIGYGAALARSAKSGKFQRQLGLKIAERRAAEQRHQARLSDSHTATDLSGSESPTLLPNGLRVRIEAIRAKALQQSDPTSSDDDSSD
jgi:hypothetical protein